MNAAAFGEGATVMLLLIGIAIGTAAGGCC
jgi:hypothetical protein